MGESAAAPPPPTDAAQVRSFVMTSTSVAGPPADQAPSRIDTVIPLDQPASALAPTAQDLPDDPVQQQWLGEEAQRFKAYVAEQLTELRKHRHERL